MGKIEKFFFFFQNYPFALIEFSSGLCLVIIAFLYYKSLIKHSAEIFCYCFIILLLEVFSNYLASSGSENHFLYLYFYIIESILLSYYYLKNIPNKKFKYFTIVFQIIIITSIVINIYRNSNAMDDYSGSLQSLGFIAISLYCYYYILSNLNIKSLMKSTIFWVNTGNFIYFSGKFFVFLFILEVLNPEQNELDGYWKIISFLLVFHRIFLAIGISQNKYT